MFTGEDEVLRMKAETGGDGSILVKTVTGAVFARWREVVLLSNL